MPECNTIQFYSREQQKPLGFLNRINNVIHL